MRCKKRYDAWQDLKLDLRGRIACSDRYSQALNSSGIADIIGSLPISRIGFVTRIARACLDLPNDRTLQQLAGGDVEVFFLREIGADYVGKISIEYLAENLDLVGKRSEEHTYELQSLMRISYDDFFLKTKNTHQIRI